MLILLGLLAPVIQAEPHWVILASRKFHTKYHIYSSFQATFDCTALLLPLPAATTACLFWCTGNSSCSNKVQVEVGITDASSSALSATPTNWGSAGGYVSIPTRPKSDHMVRLACSRPEDKSRTFICVTMSYHCTEKHFPLKGRTYPSSVPSLPSQW